MATTSATRAGRLAAPDAPWWVGAMAGTLVGAAALVAGELVAALDDRWPSPVVAVGDRAVDLSPPPVKDWAIATFGTANKTVLVVGILAVLGVLAAILGVLAVRRSLRTGLLGVAALAGVGVAASAGRGGAGPSAPVPTLAAAATAAVLLVALVRLARAGWGPPPATAAIPDDRVVSARVAVAESRRRFLVASMGTGVMSLAVGRLALWLRQQAAVTAERLGVVLPRPAVPAPPVPAAVEVGTPGVAPFITPTSEFFRIDTALRIPRVDPDRWRLRVTGYVQRPLTLDYEELLARPLVESVATIACVSNEVGGDLVGTARWLGCRLDDLLAEAGVRPRADQVVGVSVDGFTAGFPTAVLDGRDALVAVGMNGEPLPPRHGFPARLVVPGLYGYVSATKWLTEIRLTRFDEFEGYWIPRGWAREAPVKAMSRIDTPRPGARLVAGRAVPVAGVAWAPVAGVAAVEVQLDDGPWVPATLGREYSGTTWRQWVTTVTLDAGEHRLRVRATDNTGATQTGQARPPAPDGATGWHTVRVTAR